MKVRYQADEDFNRILVYGLRRRAPEIEFVTPAEAATIGLPDDRVLETSALHGRILVSHDATTMPMHFSRFLETRESPGLFLIRQDCPFTEAIESLWLIWEASEAVEWVNQLRYLPL